MNWCSLPLKMTVSVPISTKFFAKSRGFVQKWKNLPIYYSTQEVSFASVAVLDGEVATLASFKSETEVVISFGYPKCPSSSETDCLIRVFVDGKSLKNIYGGDLTLSPRGEYLFAWKNHWGASGTRVAPPRSEFWWRAEDCCKIRLTHHSTGPEQKATQVGEFKR